MINVIGQLAIAHSLRPTPRAVHRIASRGLCLLYASSSGSRMLQSPSPCSFNAWTAAKT